MVNKGRLDYLQQVGAAYPTRIETEKSGSIIDPLSENFQPGKWDVLCCGGKEGSDHGTLCKSIVFYIGCFVVFETLAHLDCLV